MTLSSDVVFSFQCDGVAADFFSILQFSGTEALGDLYQFDIRLICYSDAVDTADILDSDCTLTLQAYGKKREFSGIISNFNYLTPTENGHLFQATLVPKLWLLTQFTTNEVYLGLNVSEILTLLFDEAGLASDEYDLSQINDYRRWDYRCQFGENHYNFLKRITEREGIYFYFEQKEKKSKVVFCNKKNQQPNECINSIYTPITGSSYSEEKPVIYQWTQNNKRVPKDVIIKDYNNDQPSVDLSAKASVDPVGLGEVFRYCDNLFDLDEAKDLADIRAEELLLEKTQFFGASLDVQIAPGYPLQLSAHPLQKFNIEYCPISVSHSGYAPDRVNQHQLNELPYSNTLCAIASDIQFRPKQSTEKPRFYGVLNAIVDSEGTGQYAHLDSRGRYKVVLPFDRTGRDGAQASWWIPMSQPNAGENSGMHFPLLKGAEVLLSFIGGDPDRPVITGAVPNAARPSVVREDNHTQNKIKTAANNIIEMEDEADSERIKLYSPNSSSYLHLGAANPINANGIMMMTSGGYYQEIGGGCQITRVTTDNLNSALHEAPTPAEGETAADMTNGVAMTGTVPLNLDGSDVAKDLLNERSLTTFKKGDDNGLLGSELSAEDERSGKYFIHREHGEKYFWNDGNTYTFGGAKDFSYGNGYEVSYVDYENNSNWDGSFGLDYFSIPSHDPDTLLISKTIGDTYDYQTGNKEEVYFGLDEVSRAATLASTEVKATGVNTSASIAALNFNFEAGIKFDLTIAAAVDLSFGPKFERSEAKQSITGVQGVTISSGAEVSLYASPVVVPAPPTTNWESAVQGATARAQAMGLAEASLDAATAAGSLELKLDSAKLSYTAANHLLFNASGATLTTTSAAKIVAPSTTVTSTGAIALNGASVSATGTSSASIQAPTITLNGATATNISGTATSVKASAALSLQGATMSLKANAMGEVNAGGMLKISAAGLVQLG